MYEITKYLDTRDLYIFAKVSKYTRFYAIKEITNRTIFLIENTPIFSEEKPILRWMVSHGYLILHVVEEKEINKKYMDLWFFYLDKRYIEKMYQTNLKIIKHIQKMSQELIAL